MSVYDEYERERRRKIRNESRKILELLKELKFEYVVKENVPAKICFNSGRERFPKDSEKSMKSSSLDTISEISKDIARPSSVFVSTVPRFAENAQISYRTFQFTGQKKTNYKNLSFSRASAKYGDFLFKDRTKTPG